MYSFAYAFWMCLWICIFQKMWIKKECELKLIWGTSEEGRLANEIRDEFVGNEEFSHTNYKVNSKDVGKSGTIFSIVNAIVVAAFIFLSVSLFLFSKQNIFESALMSGIFNQFLI